MSSGRGVRPVRALALGAAQRHHVSSAKLGPGAVMLSIPNVIAGTPAPFSAAAGSLAAALGLSALCVQRGKSR